MDASALGLTGGIAGFSILITVVAVCGSVIFTIVLIFIIFKFIGKLTNKNSYLKTSGVDGEGKILEVRDTGITINSIYPVVDLVVEITSVKPHVQAIIRQTVSRVALPQAGSVIKIKYDPQDPTKAITA